MKLSKIHWVSICYSALGTFRTRSIFRRFPIQNRIIFSSFVHDFSSLFRHRFSHRFFHRFLMENGSQNGPTKCMRSDPFSIIFATFSEDRFLDAFWSPFGFLLASFWLPFGSLWLPLAPFWLPLAPFWLPLAHFLLLLAHFFTPFSHFGVSWRRFWSLSDILNENLMTNHVFLSFSSNFLLLRTRFRKARAD